MFWLLPFLLAVVPIVQACGGSYTLTSPSDVYILSTPGYPSPHPASASCVWNVYGPSSAAQINFECKVNTIRSNSCSKGYFKYDMNNDKVRKLCGTGRVNKSVPGPSTTFYFGSSVSSNSKFKGIECKVSYTPSNEADNTRTPDTSCRCGRKKGTRIVGGKEATANEYPWQALLKYKSGHQFCGGSLISDRYILTAAHCLEQTSASSILVTLGEHDYSSSDNYAKDYAVSQIIVHESYGNPIKLSNDIAILKLATSASISFIVSPICLPFNYRSYEFDGKTGTVTGWGLTRHGDYGSASKVLKEVDLPILRYDKCYREHVWVSTQVRNTQICTYQENKGSCQGDSGGPLVWGNDNSYYFQVGVVSYGGECAAKNHPSVFTRVTKYLDWIEQKTGSTKFCVK